LGGQNSGAKVVVREGKSPYQQLRFLIVGEVLIKAEIVKTTRRWDWKQPSFKESVIAHWYSCSLP